MRRWCANVTPRGPTARFTGPFCFFDLPRELRHMICYLARTATPDLYRATLNERPSPLIDTTTHYQQEADGWMPDRHYPLCVRVSHAFLSEAMEQYFRNVGWVARIPGSIFTTRIYLNSAKFSNPSKFQIMLETSVLTCKRRIVGWIPNSDYSRDVIEQGLRGPDGLKTLYMDLAVSLDRTKNVVAIDLSGLEAIGFSIDKLVVDVACTEWDKKKLGQLEGMMKEELRRLGCALIGQQITFTFTRAHPTEVRGARWLSEIRRTWLCFRRSPS
ncbi:hypothetical protein HBH56_188680 [Parastagonospora nodorum]|nr:hypothetical protein HBH56_188680 [Parastagonospora nodorum]KAH3925028.1 hypothetical protein HBH54_184490 [Parastagonospora nodorum]KAH3963700.1 hypothetical protein HBH51_163670 [Parastagonospora nodorum]KAH3967892.1 hypothetical protein HBH52_184630 [Parastagonospora nodorum]KAH4073802.1 hypothetical protein HBH50_038460 [Parastagonospora nodorum]